VSTCNRPKKEKKRGGGGEVEAPEKAGKKTGGQIVPAVGDIQEVIRSLGDPRGKQPGKHQLSQRKTGKPSGPEGSGQTWRKVVLVAVSVDNQELVGMWKKTKSCDWADLKQVKRDLAMSPRPSSCSKS